MENSTIIPETTTQPIMETSGSSIASKDLLLIFGAISFGLFVAGSIMFNMANYKAIKSIKKKAEQEVASQETATLPVA